MLFISFVMQRYEIYLNLPNFFVEKSGSLTYFNNFLFFNFNSFGIIVIKTINIE